MTIFSLLYDESRYGPETTGSLSNLSLLNSLMSPFTLASKAR